MSGGLRDRDILRCRIMDLESQYPENCRNNDEHSNCKRYNSKKIPPAKSFHELVVVGLEVLI
jgi:hypothetical protein